MRLGDELNGQCLEEWKLERSQPRSDAMEKPGEASAGEARVEEPSPVSDGTGTHPVCIKDFSMVATGYALCTPPNSTSAATIFPDHCANSSSRSVLSED